MKKIILSDEQIKQIESLASEGLTKNEIAGVIGVSEKTLERRINEIEEVEISYKKGRSNAKKKVINKLFEKIDEGNVTAIIFYLKTQCGWREKKEDTQEVAKGNVVIYLPEKES